MAAWIAEIKRVVAARSTTTDAIHTATADIQALEQRADPSWLVTDWDNALAEMDKELAETMIRGRETSVALARIQVQFNRMRDYLVAFFGGDLTREEVHSCFCLVL